MLYAASLLCDIKTPPKGVPFGGVRLFVERLALWRLLYKVVRQCRMRERPACPVGRGHRFSLSVLHIYVRLYGMVMPVQNIFVLKFFRFGSKRE